MDYQVINYDVWNREQDENTSYHPYPIGKVLWLDGSGVPMVLTLRGEFGGVGYDAWMYNIHLPVGVGEKVESGNEDCGMVVGPGCKWHRLSDGDNPMPKDEHDEWMINRLFENMENDYKNEMNRLFGPMIQEIDTTIEVE